MKKITLQINSDGDYREVTLDDELTIGRTDAAQVVLPDSGLSRLNTTFFREGDDVFIVDENSTNGTFVNGEQVFSEPQKVNNGDEISLGTSTQIYLEITEAREAKPVQTQPNQTNQPPPPKAEKPKKKTKAKSPENKLPMIPIMAGVSIFVIVFFALIALILVSWSDNSPNGSQTTVSSESVIPQRVIDPLGGEDPDDLDDLIATLEKDTADVSVSSTDLEDMQKSMESSTNQTGDKSFAELIVKPEFFTEMINLAKAPRSPSGERPPGLSILPELCCGVPKQTAKLEQMVRERGYTQPLDFADLAERKLNGQLLELPVATQDYVLDVGGNATEDEFNEFSWKTSPHAIKLAPGSPKYKILETLANNFSGQKYDLNNGTHRKQMKIRLLRMFNPAAKPILMEFAKAYRQKFNRPLRITSLTRSMEYQISLNGNNANSFKVSGEGSRPPHTSGCAFDLARKSMTTEEQNFMIATLADMEKRGVLDGLIEFHVNACFHIFIYDDGQKPKGH